MQASGFGGDLASKVNLSTPSASAAVNSKVVALLLIHCLLLRCRLIVHMHMRSFMKTKSMRNEKSLCSFLIEVNHTLVRNF